MNIIQVDGEYTFYKRDTLVPSGEYLITKKLDDKIFPRIAATNKKTGRFTWLVPCEEWIVKLLYDQTFQYAINPLPWWRIENKIKMTGIKLRSWQEKFLLEAIKYISNNQAFRRGLIVGLGGGKTLIALLLSCLGQTENDTIYVAPKHLHSTIKAECTKWGFQAPFITTPESCKKIENPNFTVGILDECLSCKNPKAQRTKEVTRVLKNTPVVIAMTGTPLSAEHALDLRWMRVLGTVVPEKEKNWMYLWGVNPHHKDLSTLGVTTRLNHKGEQVKPLVVDSWDMGKLNSWVAKDLYTVDISEILAEIPEATYEKVFLPTPKLFRSILRGLATEKSTSKRLTQARSCTAGFIYNDEGKAIWLEKNPVKIRWIKNFLENNPDEPVVIFSHWTAEVDRLRVDLKDYDPAFVKEQGSSDEVSRFVEGKTNVLICSASLTEGMNLQRARIAIFLSNATNPTKRIQAEGRLFRPGQQRGVVFYDLLCRGTLDLKALELLKSHLSENDAFIRAALIEELKKL